MKNMTMKNGFIFCLLLASVAQLYGQLPTNDPKAHHVLLPNGWSLSPAGRSVPLGDLPLNIQLSSSGKLLAVTNNGQSTQTLQLIDAGKEVILDNVVVPKSWYGLQFTADEKKLYASGGNDNTILVYAIAGGKLSLQNTLRLGEPWPNKISPAGLAIDEEKGILYAVTKEDNSLYALD